MKVVVKDWHSVAHWRWATGKDKDKEVTATGGADDEEDEDDLCGICRVPFEGCCPNCKVPGDDCPLSRSMWCSGLLACAERFTFVPPVHGKCTHIFHMHCLLKWIESAAAKGLCPMDRRPWETADR
ncbi:hypothetical protein M407DRAFT_111780 [Tulasnella calospora MUT 4182]|uniref:Anaphase-promoting complex subunit 11 n=1 Tax=Tulasnella calospora MUT 4182 TaxID=1051891 RepID=A0A0C3QJ33_9AGAM|nr:hypothetical protein M407DRAFT_111780 [Tulasnella calospora MUT 4182]